MKLYNIKSLENENRKILIDNFNNLYVLDKNGIHTLLKQHNISSQFFDLSKLNIDFSKFYDIRETNLKLFNKIDKKDFYKIILNFLKYLKNNYTKNQFNEIIDNKLSINELSLTISNLLEINATNKNKTNAILNLYADNNIFNKNLNTFIYNINQLNQLFNNYISNDVNQVEKIIKNLICLHTKEQINSLLQNYICNGQLIDNLQLLCLLKQQINDKLQFKFSKEKLINDIKKFQNLYTKLQFNNQLQKKITFNIFKKFLYLNSYSKEMIDNLFLPKLTFQQTLNAIYYITYEQKTINKMFSFIQSKSELKNIKNYLINIANNYIKQEFNIQLDKKLSKQQFLLILKNYTFSKQEIDNIIKK